jgi:hypothetical protein
VSKRMCPNEACERYREPTGLLGGCDCGAALVSYSDEPTNMQLGRLVSLFSKRYPEVPSIPAKQAAGILEASPSLRAAWLERHREFQAALNAARRTT